MKRAFFPLFLLLSCSLLAQKQTFDLLTYTPPKGWKASPQENVMAYSIINQAKGTWAQIGIYKSIASKGSIDNDFTSEWNNLAVKQYNATGLETNSALTAGDWKVKAGGGKFKFNNADAIVMLTTMTGYNVCVSIVATTNSQDYLDAIQNLLGTIDLKKPAENVSGNLQVNQNNNPDVTNGFAFNITNFDDGWTSTIKEDWVEVTKGSVKVLIHYPKEGTIFPADPEPLTNAAWNILVAPRYSYLKNYRTAYISTYNRPYLGFGNATNNTDGKEVFLVLFRQGESGWIEFITPDKNTFINTFKFDPYNIRWDSETDLMNPLLAMAAYNKFAVAAADFKGTWTSDFTGMQQLYNVYTGNYAGMNINQSNQTFVFGIANSYNWSILAVNGQVGNMRYAQAKSSGKFSVPNNWQVKFSDIEGKPKTYHAFWSCIKGARLLHLLDADFPGNGMYTIFGKK